MIRVLEFADVINRYDFIDTIVQFADPTRFEVSVCVRSEDHKIAKPYFSKQTKYKLLPGNTRRSALQTAWRLSRLLKEWKIDILHAHHYEPAVVAWLATRLYRRSRLVVGRHYSDSIYRNGSKLKRSALLGIEQRINRDAARIIVPSKMIFEILSERQYVDSSKIDIVHYGFVPEKYALPSETVVQRVQEEFCMAGRFVVANFSRYHEEKGHRYLIEAVNSARELCPEILVLCVGEGPERQRLEQQIREAGLEKWVRLVGWRRDAMAIMAASDAIVQSTLQEAFSQVMAEALWMAKPLVITDVSGASDIIINGTNGLLINKASSNEISEAIVRLSRDPELRRRLAVNGKKYVEENLMIQKKIREFEESFMKAVSN